MLPENFNGWTTGQSELPPLGEFACNSDFDPPAMPTSHPLFLHCRRALSFAGAAILLSGCAASPGSTPAGIASLAPNSPDAAARPGLGTKFGETRESKVRNTTFSRANATRPLTLATVAYNDADGARAQGWSSGTRGFVALSDLADLGFQDAKRKFYPLEARSRLFSGTKYGLIGRVGERYLIVLRNQSDARLEFVASVDGLDVIDGRPAALNKPGYVIAPGQTMRIEGFRRSLAQVAAFRFSSVKDSYAQKKYGDATNVGVIGVAVFSEQGTDPKARLKQEAKRRQQAKPFPGNSAGGFADPPPR